jgi:nucleosome binding factor SPN SPT16 subunit
MLKKLLDSKNIVIIEHNSNVKWQAVLRKFSENIEEFIDDGAWEYLGDHDKPAKAADDEGSVSDFVESDTSEVFSEADEDYSSDSDEYDEDGEEARGNDEEDEFEDDDDDPYSDDDGDEDEYEEDSEDSLVVRRKGEPKQKLKPGMSKKGRNK